ncbi:hypothetical protein [Sinorhizobium meliloti]|uniref:hypothetical protein n=1 Tax=Rhizobium meliloti TaxID=382 RepID=UPI0019142D47|nr:hypothetical protein [Sinorhizobium meliloti]
MTDRSAIKPLEWSSERPIEGDGVAYDAYCPIGHYIATANGWFLLGQTQYQYVNGVEAAKAAKAAAQYDFASRVRSCLLDKPEAVEGEGVKSELAAEFSRLYAEYRANSDNDYGGAMREEIELLVMENLDVFESALISYLFPADTDAAQSEIDRLRRELEEARKRRGKMSEYTPGDWTVEINDGRVNVWGRRGELLVADCGIVSNAFSQANAQLIVDAVNSYPRAHRDERT